MGEWYARFRSSEAPLSRSTILLLLDNNGLYECLVVPHLKGHNRWNGSTSIVSLTMLKKQKVKYSSVVRLVLYNTRVRPILYMVIFPFIARQLYVE